MSNPQGGSSRGPDEGWIESAEVSRPVSAALGSNEYPLESQNLAFRPRQASGPDSGNDSRPSAGDAHREPASSQSLGKDSTSSSKGASSIPPHRDTPRRTSLPVSTESAGGSSTAGQRSDLRRANSSQEPTRLSSGGAMYGNTRFPVTRVADSDLRSAAEYQVDRATLPIVPPSTASTEQQGGSDHDSTRQGDRERTSGANRRAHTDDTMQHAQLASRRPSQRLAPSGSRHTDSDSQTVECRGSDSREPQVSRMTGADLIPAAYLLPRWQPDAEVTYCPICNAQFSFFVRKHHCRKCGRVVCSACSPHRIIIPHQYIVRPPGIDDLTAAGALVDSLGSGYSDVNGLPGGERVRLCNPCVPDPNTAPPESPRTMSRGTLSFSHNRSHSSLDSSHGAVVSPHRDGAHHSGVDRARHEQHQYARARSITMNPVVQATAPQTASGHGMSAPYSREEAYAGLLARLNDTHGRSSRARSRQAAAIYARDFDFASSSRQRALPPPPPPIREEDECPVCHQELPARALPDSESLREAHITSCIQAHSAYGSSLRREGQEMAPRRTGMYVYAATEKDCVDDAECTICLEEFTVGVGMARLECLCRFHKSCISAWFINHPGRCPVHQHDGFGF